MSNKIISMTFDELALQLSVGAINAQDLSNVMALEKDPKVLDRFARWANNLTGDYIESIQCAIIENDAAAEKTLHFLAHSDSKIVSVLATSKLIEKVWMKGHL